jgi:pimeloyl-ACP methyl ester carboxylesterase
MRDYLRHPRFSVTTAGLIAWLVAAPLPAFGQIDTVVLVHGLGESGFWFNPLSDHLVNYYGSVHIRKPNLSSVSGYALQAQQLRDSLGIGAGQGAAIGHSNGGVVVREYVRQGTPVKLNRHLTIGTPHQGAQLAASALGGWITVWTFTLSATIYEPMAYYSQNDPDWYWLWFQQGWDTWYLEYAADLFLAGAEATFAGVVVLFAAMSSANVRLSFTRCCLAPRS